jgi:hypothetical protein
MLVSLLNDFGHAQGFQKMLSFIQRDKASLEHVFYFVDALCKCQLTFHKSFIDHYFEDMRKIVETKLLRATEQ